MRQHYMDQITSYGGILNDIQVAALAAGIEQSELDNVDADAVIAATAAPGTAAAEETTGDQGTGGVDSDAVSTVTADETAAWDEASGDDGSANNTRIQWLLQHAGGPGHHCASCHPSPIYPPVPGGNSQPPTPSVTTTTFPIINYPVYLPKPSKLSQLQGIPIIRQQHMLPVPQGANTYLAGGGILHTGILGPNDIIGVTGASPCVGVILIPPSARHPVYGMHFGAMQPASHNFPYLPQHIAASYSAVLLGAKTDPHPGVNNSLLNTLQETIRQLRWQNIPIQGYIPAGSAGVNQCGQLIWTTPESNSTEGY